MRIPARFRRTRGPAGVQHIEIVDTHTAGEPTRIAIAGIPALPGATLLERRDHFQREFDAIRQALLWEPRGHRDMFGAVLMPPTNGGADLAAFFMDAGGYLNMCIHGSIGLLTAALELELLPGLRGDRYRLETPAGIVPLGARFRNGRAEAVTVSNVPSFLWKADVPLHVPQLGTLAVDVAYAGNWFVLVSDRALGLDLDRMPLRPVIDVGRRILEQARAQIVVDRTLAPPPGEVGLVEIYHDVPPPHAGKPHRNVVVFGNGQYDRSPCGTGTCARMAALHARGELTLHEPFLSESVTGGVFEGRLVSELRVGHQPAVMPEVTGHAWVTGLSRVVLDPRDPLRTGFLAAVD